MAVTTNAVKSNVSSNGPASDEFARFKDLTDKLIKVGKETGKDTSAKKRSKR